MNIVSKPGSASPEDLAHQTATVRPPPRGAGEDFGLLIAVLIWGPLGALVWCGLAWWAL
jgi:hypothetical protein